MSDVSKCPLVPTRANTAGLACGLALGSMLMAGAGPALAESAPSDGSRAAPAPADAPPPSGAIGPSSVDPSRAAGDDSPTSGSSPLTSGDSPRATGTPPPSTAPGTVTLAPPEAPEPADRCPDRSEEPAEGFGHFLLGAGLFNLNDLEDRLRDSGYAELSPVITIIGGEGHALFDSGFLVGARGGALISPESEGPDGSTASISGGFGMADFGFSLVHTRPILLFLAAGIGGFGYSVDIGDGRSAAFDDVLAEPARGTSLSTAGLLGSLTVGFDGRVDIAPPERGKQGFLTLGLRLGALYGPPIGDWTIEHGGKASGGPTTALAGFFGALALGFGGRDEGRPSWHEGLGRAEP